MKKYTVILHKDLLKSQTPNSIDDIYIYLDFIRRSVEIYCNDEEKLKYNFIKVAKKHTFFKSDKDFWNRIKDITISDIKDDPYNFQIIYEVK